MQAVRVIKFGPPEVLQLTEVSDPEAGAGQLLIRIHAIGVNPVDTYIRAGTYAKKPPLPYTPGFDGAGVIAQVGAGVSGFHPGQRVYLTGSLTGTYAELAVCEPAQVHELPENVSFAQGAALGVPYVTAHYALFERGAARPGDTVLIHGATGGVGLAAVQLARAAGLQVFGTGGTALGRNLALAQGAHQVFDHTAEGYLEQITAAAPGIDLILEMLANINLPLDLNLLAPSGRVIIIGSRGPVEINPREIMSRNADIRGVMLFAAPPSELLRIHSALKAGLENGTLSPVIAAEIPLGEAARAHQLILEGKAQGKIILNGMDGIGSAGV